MRGHLHSNCSSIAQADSLCSKLRFPLLSGGRSQLELGHGHPLPGTAHATPGLTQLRDKLLVYRKRLLDLTLRNKLLNWKASKRFTLNVSGLDLVGAYAAILENDGKPVEIVPQYDEAAYQQRRRAIPDRSGFISDLSEEALAAKALLARRETDALERDSGINHLHLQFRPRNRRKILICFPRYSYSFGTFNHAFPIMGDVKGFMPPQGILVITALIPKEWEVRFIDENVRRAQPADFQWADAVFVSGMHIQRGRINDITRRAHAAGKVVALGGPSVSSAPEYYPDVDLLHCGEAGDATLRLFQHIDETVERPREQILFRTVERLPMSEFPTPAYKLIRVRDYLLGSVQFSSGCPFTCEFCDIPALYGRNPRLKTPEQVVRELDELADGGCVSCYFVDDNFIGNPKAAEGLLDALIAWQERRDYQVRLACEATLNMAGHTRILEKMQKAFFTNCFFGIETPDPVALKAMKKGQNMRMPILDAIKTVNKYGIEAASGIIMGLDTDSDETPQALMDFADVSNIPIMTVNILFALPTRRFTRGWKRRTGCSRPKMRRTAIPTSSSSSRTRRWSRTGRK
ncbi:MAG: radical SAM protein [Verrucomicrobiota bacterium]